MSQPAVVTRRNFLKNTGAAVAAAQAFAVLPSFGQTAGKKFKVALIGCGGRGTGALKDHLEAAKVLGIDIEIVALADYFEDRAKGAANSFKVDAANVHVGPTAYQKAATSSADIVLMATPPAFRAAHFEACVKAGKHVFAEKPVACDPPNIRRWFAAGEESVKKGLCMVAGTQRRHQQGYLKNAAALANGAIGRITGGQVYWCGTVPWVKRRGQGESDASYMLHNWLAFYELSGDHLVEQHVHNLDIANWYVGRHPTTALGFGGRARRETGNVFDFFSIDFDYGDDVHIHSMCRQLAGTYGRVSEFFVGSEGSAPGSGKIRRYDGKAVEVPDIKVKHDNPYCQEHIDLLEAIVAGKQLNEAKNVGESTAAAIMGRISTYTGQMVRWADVVTDANSPVYNLKLSPSPEDFENNTVKAPEDDVIPVPGSGNAMRKFS